MRGVLSVQVPRKRVADSCAANFARKCVRDCSTQVGSTCLAGSRINLPVAFLGPHRARRGGTGLPS
jgi:hypothetical protein